MPTQFHPAEVAVMQMALQALIEDLGSAASSPKLPFTPEARIEMQNILSNAKSALNKCAIASGKLIELPPFREGDEKEFFTKES